MNRKEFIKACAALGAGAPLLPGLFAACGEEGVVREDIRVDFDGRVTVVGAGAAGLTAGYILDRHGIDFEIVEASAVFGGRVKKAAGFADFPVDLGAEWIHADPSIFAELLADPTVDAELDLITYRPERISLWQDDDLKARNFFSYFYSEYKFKSSTWYDFFDRYIARGIGDRIVYDTPVDAIDYAADRVVVKSAAAGREFSADKVLVTVPLSALKNRAIDFAPALPQAKLDALDEVEMPPGLKVFIEFSQRFYPDLVYVGGLSAVLDDSDGEKIFYDAAFRKDSRRHVFALFTVGEPAYAYAEMESEREIVDAVLGELDAMFDGKASRFYRQHVVQHWTREPFIGGSYTHGGSAAAVAALARPLRDKVYFAGETYSADYQATVHGAALSAYEAVAGMLAG